MLLYNVTYPHSKGCDRDVPYTYLEQVRDDRRNEGAIARCSHTPGIILVLRAGEWQQQADI